MTATIHASPQDIQSWLRYELDFDIERAIEEHIEQCEECAELIDDVEAHNPDPFLSRLRESAVEFVPHDTAYQSHSTHYENLSVAMGEPQPRAQPPAHRWQLQRILARGGIGEVWIARDTLLGRPVAVKRLRSETAEVPSVQRRFLNEAKITARLGHPGTAYILDLVEAGSDSYYVMSLVEGRTLAEQIAEVHRRAAKTKEFAAGDLISLVQPLVSVAKTVAFAHLKGVLHRDLKSENVVVGEHGQVTVIDWGLAKIIDSQDPIEDPNRDFIERPTLPGARLGTPEFMAPEQARGDIDAIDERTDVYGLAAILYEILTGRPPFTGTHIDTVITSVIEDEPVLPRRIMPTVPLGLQDICLQGLAKQKEHRHTSAKAFIDDLEGWIASDTERKQSQSARQSLFNLTDDIMMILDEELRVVWANSTWETQLNWRLEELIGKTPLEFSHPDDLAGDPAVLAKLRRGESVAGFERRLRDMNGGFRWFSFTASPVPGENRICGIGRDIDERKRREDEHVSLLDAVPDAMVVIDADRNIRHINLQTLALFGYEREELIGQPIEMLMPERHRQAHPSYVAEFVKNPRFRPLTSDADLFALHKDGTEIPIAVSLSPVETPSGTFYASSIREVS